LTEPSPGDFDKYLTNLNDLYELVKAKKITFAIEGSF